MQDTTTGMFVETPTEYETDIDCEYPVTIHISNPDHQALTYACQQLSLFVETHDDEALVRVLEVLHPAFDSADEYAIAVGTPADTPADAWWPIELAIEDIDRDTAQAIADALEALAEDGFNSNKLAGAFRQAVIEATADQPRSLVRLVENDGSRGDGLEWHTDTDIKLDPDQQVASAPPLRGR